jgi:hypothetical protein
MTQAKVLCNMNNFVYDNLSVNLFLLSTVENPIPECIEAIPSENKAKYLGVKLKKSSHFKYIIGYKGNNWMLENLKQQSWQVKCLLMQRNYSTSNASVMDGNFLFTSYIVIYYTLIKKKVSQ